MSNHLTPSQLADEAGIERTEVISTCMELGVPIFEGKIDKTLYRASVEASGRDSALNAPERSLSS